MQPYGLDPPDSSQGVKGARSRPAGTTQRFWSACQRAPKALARSLSAKGTFKAVSVLGTRAAAGVGICAAGTPLAAPSANRFTELSPTTADHVRTGLGSEVDYILEKRRIVIPMSRTLAFGQITRLEQGSDSVRLDVFLNVAGALGQLDNVVNAIDPYETPLGRARADEALPQRVRR